MRNVKLFESKNHQFILLNESDPGAEKGIRSNQYLILHENEGVLIDPGGFGVMPRVLAEMLQHVAPDDIKAIILSHQDPDVVAGLVTWMELVKAPIYTPHLWIRFLPHYGISNPERFVAVPDQGMTCGVSPDFNLQLLPAHFLHSEGNINVYDPIAKILFSGDVGAAALPPDKDYVFVDDFKKHLPYIEYFHQRYMGGNHAARLWAETMSQFDIEMMAPQHGPIYRDEAYQDFNAWFKELKCGMDLMSHGGQFNLKAET